MEESDWVVRGNRALLAYDFTTVSDIELNISLCGTSLQTQLGLFDHVDD
jgi:hypothetical protein